MKKIIVVLLAVVVIGVLAFTFFSDSEDCLEYVKIKLTDEKYAFAVNKENPELLEKVNSVIKKIKENGELEKITEKYFAEETEKYNPVASAHRDSTKKQLVVATSTPFKPFEFSKYESGTGKQYMGIDIEIAAIIARELGCELVIKELDFIEVISAVENNEADIAMAGLSKSESRQEHVNFSDSYYSASQVLIVKFGNDTFEDCESKKDVEKILSSLGSDTKISYQTHTTSGDYLKPYNISAQGYDSAVLAAQAVLDGDVDFALVDEGAAKIIIKDMNN